MTDVGVDEFIELCPSIGDKMVENLECFLYSTKEIENIINGDVLNLKQDLISCGNDIQECLKNCNEDGYKNVTKNKNYLERITEETEKLKVLQNSLHKEIAKNEKELKILKVKLSNIAEKKRNLEDMRDEVQMYKLLTNTTFLYKGSSISGYVAGNKIQRFELDPEAVSEDDIINSLYNAVEKCSKINTAI